MVVAITSGVPSVTTRDVAMWMMNVGGTGKALSGAGTTISEISLRLPASMLVTSAAQLPVASRVSTAAPPPHDGFGASANAPGFVVSTQGVSVGHTWSL